MTIVQILLPGRPLYHYGWYNAVNAALLIIATRGLRKASRPRRIALAGAALIVAAGVASGLLGPDTQTIAGVPGSTVSTRDYGAVSFPADASVIPSRRYTTSAAFLAQPHDVVHVQAEDLRGNHLTITQPANPGFPFLSPVLLMQHTAQVAGMQVQTDEFTVPAVNKTVKAVLFTPSQIALLRSGVAPAGTAAVLFDVVPGGIGIAASGERKRIGGLLLRGDVASYPALQASAVPFLPLVIAGLVICGFAAVRSSSYSRT